MKRKELIQLYNGLNSLGDLPGVDFGYAVAKNMYLMQQEIESLQKAEAPSVEFKEYDEKRLDIVKRFAEKDENGEFILLNKGTPQEQYSITDNVNFKEDISALQEEYKDAIDGRKKQIEAYYKLIDRDLEISLIKIKKTDIPKDITTKQMYSILPIIED